MARKRKAPAQALAAIHEEEADKGPSQQNTGRKLTDDEVADLQADELADPEDHIRALIEESKEQVAAQAEMLIDESRLKSEILREAISPFIAKMSAQVRQMKAAEFFQLTPEEAASNRLDNVLQRLHRLAACDEQYSEAAGELASALTTADRIHAPTTSTLRQPQSHPRQQTSHQMRPETHQPSRQDDSLGAVGSPTKTAQPGALMPPPPSRAALVAANGQARAPMQNEVLYSANGSPIHVSEPSGPVTSVRGTGFRLADATPAVGPSCSAAIAPQTVMAFTGRTFRRDTTVRGRTKQPTRSIAVTTEDGRHFTVDDVIGLAGVPQKYREEVRLLIAADVQDLCELHKTVEAIEENNSVLPPTSQAAAAGAGPGDAAGGGAGAAVAKRGAALAAPGAAAPKRPTRRR